MQELKFTIEKSLEKQIKELWEQLKAEIKRNFWLRVENMRLRDENQRLKAELSKYQNNKKNNRRCRFR